MAADARVRIHVGGITAGVAPSDLEKTFSALGKVAGVEVVSRPDGRNFAYMDFVPNSDKSIPKLFATYNGCIWKGGKLKLEKAKEHYMDRLRQEWAEISEDAKNEHDNKQTVKETKSFGKPKGIPKEKMQEQLNIYFPKFMKVKKIPLKGTGKHKYSFQRVEVPSLPINFCDCEEHSRSSLLIPSNNEKGGVGEEELNLMNSVMNKLFAKENHESTPIEQLPDPTQAKVLDATTDDVEIPISGEAEETDDDNFVMNIGSRKNSSELDILDSKKWNKISGNQDSEGKTSTSGCVVRKESTRRKQNKNATNGALELTIEEKIDQSRKESGKVELTSSATGKKRMSIALTEEVQCLPKTHKSQSCQDPRSNKSSKPSFGIQKTSWKKLIEDAKVTTFSISDVVADINPTEEIPTSGLSKHKKVAFSSDEDYTTNVEFEEALEVEKAVDECNEKVKSRKRRKTSKSNDLELHGERKVAQPKATTRQNELASASLEKRSTSETSPQQLPSASPKNRSTTETASPELPSVSPENRSTSETSPQQLPSASPKNRSTTETASPELPSASPENRSTSETAPQELASASPEKRMTSETAPQEFSGPSDALRSDCEVSNNTVKSNYARGSAWLQNSSWTELIRDPSLSTFSVSNIVSGIDSIKPTESKYEEATNMTNQFIGGSPWNLEPEVAVQLVQITEPINNNDAKVDGESMATVEDNQNAAAIDQTEDKQDVGATEKAIDNTKTSIPAIAIGEGCSFVRNADSLKQWKRTREVVRGRIKKMANKGSFHKFSKQAKG